MDTENNQGIVDSVKSKSLVKFQVSDVPAFSRLECSLNLNEPPQNWLNGQIKNSFRLSQSMGFSSFRMAFDFFQELGEVDVISDSENIKNLLKTPYSEGSLSYFVHRVGNTLLIDEFDLHKYLLRKTDEDWEWLRSFIFENILSSLNEKEGKIFIKQKTRELLQQKNLLSKFLYHSLEDSRRPERQEQRFVEQKRPLQLSKIALPEPKLEDIPGSHVYSRNVLWTFEDIRMLIGSDMPIFGNSTRPCISLRLRDMKHPINVLTGLDYWLDNLMCNVPEIFMCYHIDGIVQKYELLKTEDLPHLENSKFSPKVIRNVAQNILSFLKSNATKSGHTYWLFKGKNDDVVKLYDLTTLQLIAESCKSEKSRNERNESNQNPFTIPVAMLLYTVARNMKNSQEKLTAKQAGSIKTLLDNCLKLLPKEKYPQIVSSSHYILSDLHINQGMDPANPSTSFEDTGSDSEDFDDQHPQQNDSDDEMDECQSGKELCPAVQSIQETIKEYQGNNSNSGPKPLILGSIQERCEEALKHCLEGLSCLQYFESEAPTTDEEIKEKERIFDEEMNPNLAKTTQPIPLPYEKLKPEPLQVDPYQAIPMGWCDNEYKSPKQTTGIKDEIVHETIDINSKSLLMKGAQKIKNWNTHLKVLLIEKASLTYATMAENSYSEQNFGSSLKYLKMSMMCQNLVKKYVSPLTTQNSCLYGRAGDCYFRISKNIVGVPRYCVEFNMDKMDKEILVELEKEDIENNGFELEEPMEDEKLLLEMSCKCYEGSLVDTSITNESRYELERRLGNVYNEFGVFLMHESQQQYSSFVKAEEDGKESQQTYQQIAKQSYDYLMKAVSLFESVEDSVNLIVCNLNLGRFFRFSAHINILRDHDAVHSLRTQKEFYNKSFKNYNRALSILETRKKNAELWDLINWELSTATFNLAKQMQDFGSADVSTGELEQEVLDMLFKALKLCDLETCSPRQVLYQFRAGLIYHRLASFYHQSLRSSEDKGKRRNLLLVCQLNYEKAANILESLREFKDFFQVQMERIALQEHLAELASNPPLKMKLYNQALQYMFDSSSLLHQLSLIKTPEPTIDFDELQSLLDLFEKRLQFVLKSLAKLALTKNTKKEKPGSKSTADVYKNMFGCTLRTPKRLELWELANVLATVLDKALSYKNCE